MRKRNYCVLTRVGVSSTLIISSIQWSSWTWCFLLHLLAVALNSVINLSSLFISPKKERSSDFWTPKPDVMGRWLTLVEIRSLWTFQNLTSPFHQRRRGQMTFWRQKPPSSDGQMINSHIQNPSLCVTFVLTGLRKRINHPGIYLKGRQKKKNKEA